MRRSEAIKALGTVLLGGGAAASHGLLEERQQSSAAGFTDVRTHGAKGDGVADDHAAIQSAIEAVRAGGGGVVWFPRGRYKIGATVVVPVVLNETVLLRGEGMRSAYLYPASKGMTAVRFGASTPDDSGISASKTQYCGMEDLSVSGSLLPPGTSVGVEFVEMQKGWMRNVIIEEFDKGASVGLHLRGSRTTRGVGAAAPPHTWRCTFTNVVVPTTMRPLLIDNGDENDRSEEHTSELQSPCNLVCRLLLEKKKTNRKIVREQTADPTRDAPPDHTAAGAPPPGTRRAPLWVSQA